MEQMNPYLKDVMNYVEQNVSARPAQFDEVKVQISTNTEVLATYIDELYSNIRMAVSLKGGDFGIDVDTFTKYIHTIIKTRVDFVVGNKILFGPTERVVVPSFLSCVLSNIGRARHIDYGIELIPDYKGGDVFTNKTEFMRVSNQLKILKGIGFEYAEGYTRSKEGSFDFMTMALIDGTVRNISKEPHPVYALLSSTLGVRGVETVLSPRITYGSETHLASLVRALAVLKV